MSPIIDTESGPVFIGSVDDTQSLAAAEEIAQDCVSFTPDDDDECYIDGDRPTCFNCRARRWTQSGFSCMNGLLRD